MRIFIKYGWIIVVIMMIGVASAVPEFLNAFNSKYGSSKTILDACNVCHIDKDDLKACEYCHASQKFDKAEFFKLNPYGKDLKKNKNMSIDKALSKIENLSSNDDGVSNLEKIRKRTLPGKLNKTK